MFNPSSHPKAGPAVPKSSLTDVCLPVFKNFQYGDSKNSRGSLLIYFTALKVREIFLLSFLMSKLDVSYCSFQHYPLLHLQQIQKTNCSLFLCIQLSFIWLLVPYIWRLRPGFLCLFLLWLNKSPRIWLSTLALSYPSFSSSSSCN